MKNIKVMVIDDSALVRQVLSEIINRADGMEVVEVAIDPIFAQQKLQNVKPDVITLDIEMPRMDGLTFLEKLMRENPIPVVMCSKLTQKLAPASLRALNLGAVDVVGKPLANMKNELPLHNQKIINAIRAAATVNPARLRASTRTGATAAPPEKLPADVIPATQAPTRCTASARLIAIGASMGGTQALEYMLARLDADATGIVIVQHMNEAFTDAFAQRLDNVSRMQVKQAEHGDRIRNGTVLVAPGGCHTVVENHSGELRVAVKSGPLVSRHCPSVDVLFRSAARTAARETLGIIMTGMGDDGAHGMKELLDAGAFTVAQDEASCVVFGMPGRAIEEGGVSSICSLEGIPVLMNAFGRPNAFESLISTRASSSSAKALAKLADNGQ